MSDAAVFDCAICGARGGEAHRGACNGKRPAPDPNAAIIHINRNIIQRNARRPPEEQEPPCRVERKGKVLYCWEVKMLGESKMVYRPDTPRPCGAKLWIETLDTVGLDINRNGLFEAWI